MPGGYIATLRGRAGRIAVPFQVRTIFVQQPPEGVVRSAKVSSSRTGRQGVRLPAGVTQAWAIFRFAAQPTIAPIRAEWFLPSGQSIGSDTKNNAPVVRTGIGLSSGIPTGRYTVLLRAGTRVVKRLSVRVGV